MRYKIRSYADDPRLFWVVDTQTGRATTDKPLTRNEALRECEQHNREAAK